MDSNSVSPMPELAPIAEFDKTPPTPPEDTLPMDDLPPPPTAVTVQEEKEKEANEEWVYPSFKIFSIKMPLEFDKIWNWRNPKIIWFEVDVIH